jgi:hypothetical protein
VRKIWRGEVGDGRPDGTMARGRGDQRAGNRCCGVYGKGRLGKNGEG